MELGEIIRFKELKYASLGLFLFSLFLIPFNTTLSTLFMFAVVGLWSRVPAFLSSFTKDSEIIDFLSFVISISLGGLAGGLFGCLLMLFSRIFAPLEYPGYTIKDAVALFVSGISAPFIFFLTGGNMLLSMYGFTVVRYIIYILLTAFFEPQWMMLELGYCFLGIFTSYLSNTIMISVFGDFTTNILKTGIGFNFSIFVFIFIVLFFVFFTKIIEILKFKKKPSKKTLWEISKESKYFSL